ncbi:hypothetical protein VNO77_17009 [Canavalia gladiata]|uniref:Uncharacterized protein n=1 Tax=Canavalia gladiata TaxID=3824 RepID=A0AAN9QID7_CANGL
MGVLGVWPVSKFQDIEIIVCKGVQVELLANTTDLNEVASAIRPRTKLVWLEGATDHQLQISDFWSVYDLDCICVVCKGILMPKNLGNTVDLMSFNNAALHPASPFLASHFRKYEKKMICCYFRFRKHTAFSLMIDVLQVWIITKSNPDFHFYQAVYLTMTPGIRLDSSSSSIYKSFLSRITISLTILSLYCQSVTCVLPAALYQSLELEALYHHALSYQIYCWTYGHYIMAAVLAVKKTGSTDNDDSQGISLSDSKKNVFNCHCIKRMTLVSGDGTHFKQGTPEYIGVIFNSALGSGSQTANYNLSHTFIAMVPKCVLLDALPFLISRCSMKWAIDHSYVSQAYNKRNGLK